MANAYATITNLLDLVDKNTVDQLSNDLNGNTAYSARIQRLLDYSASWMESYLDGLYSLPVKDGGGNIPMCLTMLVCKKTEELLFGRRIGAPAETKIAVEAMYEWLKAIKKETANVPNCQRINGPTLAYQGDPWMQGSFPPWL